MTILPAGPELDALMAEKVMGWKRGSLAPQIWYERDPEGAYRLHRHSDGWKPSTEIANAWEVVERMSRLCGSFAFGDGFFHVTYAESADHSLRPKCEPTSSIPVDLDRDDDPEPWSCHIHVGLMAEKQADTYPDSWDHGSSFCARGATAQLAICYAALKAVETK